MKKAKKKKKRRTKGLKPKLNMEEPLDFQFRIDPPSPDFSSEHHSRPRRRKKAERYIPAFSREDFVKSTFQFMLLPNACLPTNIQYDVEWENVVAVRFISQEPVTCPICLSPPTAPRITTCGHLFCYQCLFHHYQVSADEAKCPLCAIPFSITRASIAFHTHVPPVKVGDTLSLTLQHRKGLYLTPQHEAYKTHCYDRFMKVDDMSAIFHQQEAELKDALKESMDYEVHYGSMVLDALALARRRLEDENGRLAERAQRREGVEDLSESQFYQAVDGTNCFLEPLCWQILNAAFPGALPGKIEGAVKHIQQFSINESNATFFRHLKHLPLGSVVSTVELSMEALVPAEAYAEFQDRVAARDAKREKELRRARKEQQQYSTKSKQDLDAYLLKRYSVIDWDGQYMENKVKTDDLEEFPEFNPQAGSRSKSNSPTKNTAPKREVRSQWNTVTERGLATSTEELWPSLGVQPTTAKVVNGKGKRGRKGKKGKKKKWRKTNLSFNTSTPV